MLHGGSYLFYSDASTVELDIADGGILVGHFMLITTIHVNTYKAKQQVRVFGGLMMLLQMFLLYDLTVLPSLLANYNLRIHQTFQLGNWECTNTGSATFGNTVMRGVYKCSTNTRGSLLGDGMVLLNI